MKYYDVYIITHIMLPFTVKYPELFIDTAHKCSLIWDSILIRNILANRCVKWVRAVSFKDTATSGGELGNLIFVSDDYT